MIYIYLFIHYITATRSLRSLPRSQSGPAGRVASDRDRIPADIRMNQYIPPLNPPLPPNPPMETLPTPEK